MRLHDLLEQELLLQVEIFKGFLLLFITFDFAFFLFFEVERLAGRGKHLEKDWIFHESGLPNFNAESAFLFGFSFILFKVRELRCFR